MRPYYKTVSEWKLKTFGNGSHETYDERRQREVAEASLKGWVPIVQSVLDPSDLHANYRNHPLAGTVPYFGHCYVASEALYHLAGRRAGYGPRHAKDDSGITHWWLQRSDSIVDPTSEQYTSRGLTPPYEDGTPCGFLTVNPSKRAQAVITKAREANLKRPHHGKVDQDLRPDVRPDHGGESFV